MALMHHLGLPLHTHRMLKMKSSMEYHSLTLASSLNLPAGIRFEQCHETMDMAIFDIGCVLLNYQHIKKHVHQKVTQ